MIKLIKSGIAGIYYQKALGCMGSTFPGLALGYIRKAVKIEQNDKFRVRYLSLQGEIEIGLGFKEKALATLIHAEKIIDKYPNYWNSSAHKDIANRVKEAIIDLNKEP